MNVRVQFTEWPSTRVKTIQSLLIVSQNAFSSQVIPLRKEQRTPQRWIDTAEVAKWQCPHTQLRMYSQMLSCMSSLNGHDFGYNHIMSSSTSCAARATLLFWSCLSFSRACSNMWSTTPIRMSIWLVSWRSFCMACLIFTSGAKQTNNSHRCVCKKYYPVCTVYS